jgi:hypothetical protein
MIASVWFPRRKLREAVEKFYPYDLIPSIIVVLEVLYTTFYQI